MRTRRLLKMKTRKSLKIRAGDIKNVIIYKTFFKYIQCH